MTRHQLPNGPFTFDEAAAVGTGKQALARMVRDGTAVKVHPGLYWAALEYSTQDFRTRHLAIARRVLEGLDGSHVLARESAACALRIATPRRRHDGRAKLSLYTTDNRNARNAPGIQVTVSPLHIGDTIERDGLPLTSVCRTTIDLARGLALPFALIPLDSALRAGVIAEELLTTAQRMKGWSGTKLLKAFIPLADGKAESALESAARGICIASGLPAPELQHELFGASGRLYRVDMVWLDDKLVVEPDGWGKYGNDADQQRVHFRHEKTREDDIREAGFTVLRVTWDGLNELPGRVARHLADRRLH